MCALTPLSQLGVLTLLKGDLEEQLRKYKPMVTYLQAEAAALGRDRDNVKGNLRVSRGWQWCFGL